MTALRKLFNVCLVVLSYGICASAEELTALEQKIKNDGDLSEFFVHMQKSPLARVSLQYKQVTIFAPTNLAFQRHKKPIEDSNELVLYHMINVPKRTDELGNSYTALFSELEGTPILWVTHISGTYHNDIFVNNARVLISQSNIQINQNKNIQILHKIDEVLVPTRSPKSEAHRVYNPTALEFLTNYESLIINPYRVRSFRQRVEFTGRQDIYSVEGGHTFFIPVEEGFKDGVANKIDGKVIDGHVIPRKVLFTSPSKKDYPFETLANKDNIRVVISFTEEVRGKNNVIHYVKSHTLTKDGVHTPGVVLAKIVKANIPVKNGVVHLISKPLMVVHNTVRELLQENQGGILTKFMEAVNLAGPVGDDFMTKLNSSTDITLFAPCSNAWDNDLALNNIIRDSRRFTDILNMHLVVEKRLYVDGIIDNNRNYPTHTLNKGQNLYFNVMTSGTNRTITVEGGGVNATFIQADLAATNGVVHIIDRVLGVPYTTVLDKLRTDPTLNDTYYLGSLQGFNHKLNDTSKKFTYFVPRDFAWKNAKITLPSATKVLFMPEYAYHATNILERHLVIDSAPYTMERIKLMSNDSSAYGTFGPRREVGLPTIREGSLKLYVEEKIDHSFVIHWRGEKIKVFRPNVECTNGIIHVIDMPFLQDGDVRVSGATQISYTPHILMVVFAKWLLL